MDRAPRTQLQQARNKSRQASQRVEGLGAEPIADDGVVDGLHLLHEVVQALGVAGVEPAHLRLHALHVTHVVQRRAVVEVDPVVGIQRDEIHIVDEPAAGRAKDVVDDARRRDQAGAHVEDVATVLELIGAPSDALALLEERDLEAGGLEADGEGEAPEAAADHHGATGASGPVLECDAGHGMAGSGDQPS